MSATLNQQAELAAARVDAAQYGFDPLTILTILQFVLPLLANCFNRNEEPDMSQMKATIARRHSKNPEKLLRQTARRILWESADSANPVTKAQSKELARAVIAQALEADEQTVTMCAMEAAQQ